jgi:hypothetical protein
MVVSKAPAWHEARQELFGNETPRRKVEYELQCACAAFNSKAAAGCKLQPQALTSAHKKATQTQFLSLCSFLIPSSHFAIWKHGCLSPVLACVFDFLDFFFLLYDRFDLQTSG